MDTSNSVQCAANRLEAYENVVFETYLIDSDGQCPSGTDQQKCAFKCEGFYNQTTAAVNRWSYEGQRTDIPRAVATTSEEWVNNERFSDRWIEDGSYLKLKKVRVSYELPINSAWIQGLTIWAEGNNLFTLTKYLGKDPEVSCGNSVLYQGIDAGLLPSGRSFNLGVKINL